MPSRKLTTFRLIHASDRALLAEFGGEIPLEFDPRPVLLSSRARGIPGVVAAQPAYTSVLVKFDPSRVRPEELSRELEKLGSFSHDEFRPREHVIPVHYDGPDLAEVASLTGLSERKVIELHSGARYCVAFPGFMPGFAYLSGLPRELRVPRLATARLKIPSGTVSIADLQTGIYPVESPGGWRLIGSASVPLLDWKRDPPALLRPGDSVVFEEAKR